jgi:3-phosphoshikimate 1-carboxyvinyltransferase
MKQSLISGCRTIFSKNKAGNLIVRKSSGLKGEISLPGDKSIAQRAIIISSLSEGRTKITNFPTNQDCLSAIEVFKKLGVRIIRSGDSVYVYGKGLQGLRKPKKELLIDESGTTFRLLIGVLAGQKFDSCLRAGSSLSRRPMSRVNIPLRLMGAHLNGQTGKRANRPALKEEYPPIIIHGNSDLRGIKYKMPVASAQVKSAILLAGLYARGITEIMESVPSRDHTERMLKLFGADLDQRNHTIVLKGTRRLVSPKNLDICADISSAAFFLVAASVIPGSNLTIKKVGLNPLRIGVINVLKKMGAHIQIKRLRVGKKECEPSGDIIVRSSSLKCIRIKKNQVPSLIDEIPVLMVAASFAKGMSRFEGVGELRIKETDRINSMLFNLNKMGGDVKVQRSGANENIIIKGPVELNGGKLKSFSDHRSAMSLIVAGLNSAGQTLIDDVSCIAKSFPDFISTISKLYK